MPRYILLEHIGGHIRGDKVARDGRLAKQTRPARGSGQDRNMINLN